MIADVNYSANARLMQMHHAHTHTLPHTYTAFETVAYIIYNFLPPPPTTEKKRVETGWHMFEVYFTIIISSFKIIGSE